MNSSQIVKELLELKTAWRRQNFVYTKDQRSRYDELLNLRREIVKQYWADGKVWIGPSVHAKPKD